FSQVIMPRRRPEREDEKVILSGQETLMPTGTLTPEDNFAGRSTRDFGIGETILLGFRDDDGSSTPDRAQQLGGLRLALVARGGTLAGDNHNGVGRANRPP